VPEEIGRRFRAVPRKAAANAKDFTIARRLTGAAPQSRRRRSRRWRESNRPCESRQRVGRRHTGGAAAR